MKNQRQQACLAAIVLGCLWFVLGSTLLGAPPESPVRVFGVVATVGGMLAALVGFICGIGAPAEASKAEPVSAADTNAPPLTARHFVLMVLLTVAGVGLGIAGLFWWQERQRKADTVGYAELSAPWFTMNVELPAGWRIRYASRDRRWYYQGRVVDDQGRARFRVYGSVRAAADLERIAATELELYRKSGLPVEWSEYRATDQGRWWAYAVKVDQRDPFFEDRPLLLVRYFRQRDGVHLEMTMPAAEAGSLEPLAWRLVQTAQLRLGS